MVSGIFDGTKQEESIESQRGVITRSLLMDFSERSETSYPSECYSVVTDQGVITGESSASKEDDNASVWSIQVNASIHGEDEEETIDEMGDDYYENEEDEENDDDDDDDDNGGLIDELCEGLRKISMEEMFRGKHTRFVYNSVDEIIQGEEKEGLPTPKGKHLRFPLDKQDDR
ncbi:hypothetical protein DITRI_Ditri16bG0008700 [Diplodiscus trichospermus]